MMTAIDTMQLPFDTAGLRGTLKLDEPMSKHTSWRVGGPAQYFYAPADRDDVVVLMKRLPTEMPICWVGLGSNLLVRDGGFKGMVIKTPKALSNFKIQENKLYAEAGVTCAKLAKVSTQSGLTGAEFFAGVPGSFGGALAMNAGAFGGETWPLVMEIDCLDRQGNITILTQDQIDYSYRSVNLPKGAAILSGLLQLSPAESATEGKQRIRSLLEKRSASQPIQSANAGSVFKNPKDNYAANIIERLELKGKVIGGARFSEVHANFIINDGSATAANIETLMHKAQHKAREQFDVQLEPEVRIVGDAS